MNTKNPLPDKVRYIKKNLSKLTTPQIMRKLDIPLYNEEDFTRYIYTTVTGQVSFAMQLVDGKWVDITEIEQLKAEQAANKRELNNLKQEALLTHAKG